MASAYPTPEQLAWQELEFGIFYHFGINTFTGKELGDGSEDPRLFMPTALDCRQWVQAAKRAGARYAILTAKHHDGFCLWPTSTTDHCTRSIPWRDGEGDVVREFVDACRAEGILPGLYCSPWDRNASCYADPAAYSSFYEAQLTELCSRYGPLVEVWFDGFGSEGYRYDWSRIMRTVRRLQPHAVVFNMGDPDVRWGGNEAGFAGPDLWTRIDKTRTDGYWGEAELPSGDGRYLPAEMDATINEAGWFWHPDSTSRIRSLDELVGMYYRSVGHGTNLLLNAAPNRQGLLDGREVDRLGALGDTLRRRFGSPAGAAEDGTDLLEIELATATVIGRFEAMEDLSGGEHVLGWVLEAEMGHLPDSRPAWHRLATGTALGHRRLGDFAPLRTTRVRLRVLAARGEPHLRRLHVFAP